MQAYNWHSCNVRSKHRRYFTQAVGFIDALWSPLTFGVAQQCLSIFSADDHSLTRPTLKLLKGTVATEISSRISGEYVRSGWRRWLEGSELELAGWWQRFVKYERPKGKLFRYGVGLLRPNVTHQFRRRQVSLKYHLRIWEKPGTQRGEAAGPGKKSMAAPRRRRCRW